MELSKQVCNLEISQRLKALGVEQKSLFVWQSPTGDALNRDAVLILREKMKRFIYISAFTTSELGEMLLEWLNKGTEEARYLLWRKIDQRHQLSYEYEGKDVEILFFADTESDCRGLMLIYLLEQGLLKKVALSPKN